MSSILYIGPSWAARSYDTVEGSESEFTNLIKELELDVDVIDLSKRGLTNNDCLMRINKINTPFKGIIWVYCEPIEEVSHNLKQSLIESNNFWAIREKINQRIMSSINALNCPVALIGAHSDVGIKDYKNITVIHPSWQKFLANEVGVELNHGWGAEIAHRIAMYEFPKSRPSREFIDYTSDTLRAWNQMEMLGVFRGVHPNRKGNEIFAKEIKSNIQSFINNL
jgi:hypothetical protein